MPVGAAQHGLVASNAVSLAEAKVNPTLVPLAIYDGAARGYEQPSVRYYGSLLCATAGLAKVLSVECQSLFG